MLLVNKIQCNLCGDIISSAYRHDFNCCNCGAVAVDGGISYRRILGTDYTDLSIYSDKHEEIRKYLTWGTRGKDGTQPLTYKPIMQLDTGHIEAILDTQWHVSDELREVFKAELEYRKNTSASS